MNTEALHSDSIELTRRFNKGPDLTTLTATQLAALTDRGWRVAARYSAAERSDHYLAFTINLLGENGNPAEILHFRKDGSDDVLMNMLYVTPTPLQAAFAKDLKEIEKAARTAAPTPSPASLVVAP